MSPVSKAAGPAARLQRDVLGTRSQRAILGEGVLGSLADSVMQFLPVYMVLMAASAAEVGLLSSAMGLAGLLALLPGAWLARHARWRKAVVMFGAGGLGRLVLLALAAVPFLLDGQAAVIALIALGGMRSLMVSISGPAWISVFADVIPDRTRRSFASLRQFSTAITAMIAAPVFGWLITTSGGASGFQLALLIAAAAGLAATWSYSRVPAPDIEEETAAEVDAPPSIDASLWRDRTFVRFLLAAACLQLFAAMAGPFFLVYLVRHLGASAAEVGALAMVDPAAAVVGQAVAAYLAVRFASRRLLASMIAVSTAMPLTWLLIGAPWQAAIPNFISGATWAVFHLATFNLLIELGSRDKLPRYAAAFQATGMVGAFAGPLIGSGLVAVAGIPALFAISGAGRLLALALLVGRVPAGVPSWRLGRRRLPSSVPAALTLVPGVVLRQWRLESLDPRRLRDEPATAPRWDGALGARPPERAAAPRE